PTRNTTASISHENGRTKPSSSHRRGGNRGGNHSANSDSARGNMYNSSTPNNTPRHWDERASALAAGEIIRVASAAAGKAGVRAGMSVPEARVYSADLEVRAWDDRAVTDAVMAVTGELLQCSPQVT